MRIRYIYLIILVMVSALLISSCKGKESKKQTLKRELVVSIENTKKETIKQHIEAVGSLMPFDSVTVSSEVDGIIKDVKVDEGYAVSKGDLLALIDDTDYTLEMQRAKASLNQAEANLENTKLEFERKNALYKEELVTKQQFDDVKTRLALATAELDRAKASLSLAKQKLTKTKIVSPLSGAVKEKKVSPGDYVRIGSGLFSIIQTNPLKLSFSIPEKDSKKIRIGQQVEIKVDAYPEEIFDGKLTLIDPHADEKTRTVRLEAQIPNPQKRLKPGFFAKVTLITGIKDNAVLIPTISLLYEGEKTRIFVVEGDTAKERIVKIGQKFGEYIEITEGLKEGEIVVIAGQQNLFENAKVKIVGSKD
ncbi:MAG: efflux RND transporter periplasmic adaptor subunit [Nitrospirota bacterium]